MATQVQGLCIFCNGTGLSKQHIWPDWFKKIIPHKEIKHTQYLTYLHLVKSKTLLIQPVIKIKTGELGSRKIRNVCIKCNSEWMSVFETNAQQTLISLIKGEIIKLDYITKLNISKWVVLTCIMAEYTDLPTQSISQQNRLHLYNKKTPPSNWRIWIGKYEGNEWKQRYRHHGLCKVLKENEHLLLAENKPKGNMQFSTIVWGSLLIHAISVPESTDLNDYVFPDYLNIKLRSIWPLGNYELKSDSEIISDIGAMEIADYFHKDSIKYMP